MRRSDRKGMEFELTENAQFEMFAHDMSVHAVGCSTFVVTSVLPSDVDQMVLAIGAVR